MKSRFCYQVLSLSLWLLLSKWWNFIGARLSSQFNLFLLSSFEKILKRPSEHFLASFEVYFEVWYKLILSDKFWWSLIHCDTVWYILMQSDAAWYILMQSDTFWCGLIHSDAIWYSMIHSDTIFIKALRTESWVWSGELSESSSDAYMKAPLKWKTFLKKKNFLKPKALKENKNSVVLLNDCFLARHCQICLPVTSFVLFHFPLYLFKIWIATGKLVYRKTLLKPNLRRK